MSDVTISMKTVLSLINAMALSADNKKWLAEQLNQEAQSEGSQIGTYAGRRDLTDDERDKLLEKAIGSWKDNPVADIILEDIQRRRQSVI